MSLTNTNLRRGERRAQSIRPATFTYAGRTIPCTPGNLDFFQRLHESGAGFNNVQGLFIKILRSDIPAEMLAANANFQRGHAVTITNSDPDSPGRGEAFNLIIGENNSWQPAVLILNLEKQLG